MSYLYAHNFLSMCVKIYITHVELCTVNTKSEFYNPQAEGDAERRYDSAFSLSYSTTKSLSVKVRSWTVNKMGKVTWVYFEWLEKL